MPYCPMILGFRHRGLKLFDEKGQTRGIRQDQAKRIRRILAILDSAGSVDDIDQLPGMRLHPLKGDLAGCWSVAVSGNWRIIFRFNEGHASDIDLVDYH